MVKSIYDSAHILVHSRKATIGIVGLGYVGLPLAMEFSKYYKVLGFDVSNVVLKSLAQGISHIQDIPDSIIKKAVDGNFKPILDSKGMLKADFIIICVPTPLKENKTPDLSYIESVASTIGTNLRRGQIVILESTTYPGTTEGPLKNWLEDFSGLIAGKDFGLAFSPERIDPGNKIYTVSMVPKVVGGLTGKDTEIVAALYKSIIKAGVVKVKDAKTAEAVKLMENIFRHVNIALANEMALVMEKMDINVWEVIDAASTKPYGYMPFYPGPGVGGHCIPLDPYYLSFAARKKGIRPQFIELSGDTNNFMKIHTVNLLEKGLQAEGIKLHGATIGILGLAYKNDINDTRESPAIDIIHHLVERGARVAVYDPYVKNIETPVGVFKSKKNASEIFKGADGVIVVTNHSAFKKMDYRKLAGMMKHQIIVDTRNIVSSKLCDECRLIKVGVGQESKNGHK